MGISAQCQHFRSVRPRSQLLGAVFDPSDAKISEALSKIVETAETARRRERVKRVNINTRDASGRMRPSCRAIAACRRPMVCTPSRSRGNAGGQCPDFLAGKHERQRLRRLRAPEPSAGEADDRRREATYIGLVNSSTATGLETKSADDLLGETPRWRDRPSRGRGRGVYNSHGHMAAKPMYVDTCGAPLGPGRVRRVRAGEPSQRVPDVSARGRVGGGAGSGRRRRAGRARRLGFADRGAARADDAVGDAGWWWHCPTANASPFAAGPAVAGPMGGAAPDAVLAPGNPPLTVALADAVIAAFAWMLDVQIPAELAAGMRTALGAAWGQASAPLLSLAQAHQAAAQHGQAMLDFQREASQPQFVAMVRAERRHRPLAAPAPSAVRHGQSAAGTRQPAPDPGDRRLLPRHGVVLDRAPEPDPVAATRARGPAAVRGESRRDLAVARAGMGTVVSAFPLEWARTRANWEMLDDMQREQVRAQLVRDVGQVFHRYDGLAQKPRANARRAPRDDAPGPFAEGVADLTTSLMFGQERAQLRGSHLRGRLDDGSGRADRWSH